LIHIKYEGQSLSAIKTVKKLSFHKLKIQIYPILCVTNSHFEHQLYSEKYADLLFIKKLMNFIFFPISIGSDYLIKC